MKTFTFAAALGAATLFSTTAFAAAERYTLDPSHSQVVFSYNHLGFSTTYNMFSGFEGEIMFDAEDPAGSSVSVSMPVTSLFTGWDARFEHFMADDFFGASDGDLITFTSTSIDVTGDTSALITGDLTVNGITKPVTLDTVMTKIGDNPMSGKPWVGFNATAEILRSDFDLGGAAPAVSDGMNIIISIEAGKAE
ncbi:MAG: YceI family protein [Pseudomonadota bacterium]